MSGVYGLTVGKENPQRETGSVILKRWREDRLKASAAAEAPKQKRNYAGAAISRINTGWGTTSSPASWHVWNGLQALRSRSREQYRNNDYARRFIAMCKSNIIGPNGVALQSRVADPDGTPDKLANDAIERVWKEWSRRECDVSGRLSLVGMCRLIVSTVAVDGECLVRRFHSGDSGFQLKLVDPELLDIRYNETRSNGVVVRMGVEMDQHGKPLAYYLHDGAADSHSSSYNAAGKHVRVPADEMLHLYLPEMIDQVRGVPWMASALVRMKNLHGYEEAAVIAARIGASKMGFFKAPEGAEPLADDEDIRGEFIQDAEPGAFEVLPEGYDFTAFNPDYPHQQFGDFIKATLRGIASGLGVAYNGLANDLEGVNYSSIRAGVLEEREQWKALQAWLVDVFMRPVFESWLDTQLALGTIKVPSKSGIPKALPADRFDKFRQVSFQPRRWHWVDPQKDMNANAKGIELMLKSRSEIIRDLGRDPDEVWAEIARENKALEKFNISPEAVDAKMRAMSQELQDAED